MLLVANFTIQNGAKNYWNPGMWVLIWECSARAFQYIPRWQGLDGLKKIASLCFGWTVASALEWLKKFMNRYQIILHRFWIYPSLFSDIRVSVAPCHSPAMRRRRGQYKCCHLVYRPDMRLALSCRRRPSNSSRDPTSSQPYQPMRWERMFVL